MDSMCVCVCFQTKVRRLYISLDLSTTVIAKYGDFFPISSKSQYLCSLLTL